MHSSFSHLPADLSILFLGMEDWLELQKERIQDLNQPDHYLP